MTECLPVSVPALAVQLPLLLWCKYAIDNKVVRARLLDIHDCSIHIMPDNYSPPSLANRVFPNLEHFCSLVLRLPRHLATKQWYLQDPQHFDKLITLHSLLTKYAVSASPVASCPLPAGTLPVPTGPISFAVRVPSLVQRFNAYRTLDQQTTMRVVSEEEWSQALTVHQTPPDSQGDLIAKNIVKNTSASATCASTTPRFVKNDQVSQEAATDDMAMSALECVRILLYGVIFTVKTSLPLSALHSVLVIDRYTSRTRSIPLEDAMRNRNLEHGHVEDDGITCAPSTDGASTDRSLASVFQRLQEWTRMNLDEDPINMCDDITFRFTLHATYTQPEVEALRNSICEMSRRLQSSMSGFISSVTILDYLYVSLFPFRLVIPPTPLQITPDVHPVATNSVAAAAHVTKDHHNFFLPQLSKTVESAILAKALARAGMWDDYGACIGPKDRHVLVD